MGLASYVKTLWSDRAVQFPRRYRDQANNQYTFTPDEGTITNVGTSVTATRLNKLETGVENVTNEVIAHEASGFIGEEAVLSVTDFDSLTTPGVYHGILDAAVANEPYTGSGARRVTVVVRTNGGHIQQEIIYENATNEGYIYRRNYDNSWATWMKILTTRDYDTLFQYANDGKAGIASAVTAKGVSASSGDTFAALATKVGQIGSHSTQSYTTPGTYTFTVPTGVTQVTAVVGGAGGGGGGGAGAGGGEGYYGGGAGAGGGGAGAYIGVITVTPGQEISVIVGTGGAGGIVNGVNPGAGGTGGSSSFSGNSASGGTGGRGGGYGDGVSVGIGSAGSGYGGHGDNGTDGAGGSGAGDNGGWGGAGSGTVGGDGGRGGGDNYTAGSAGGAGKVVILW